MASDILAQSGKGSRLHRNVSTKQYRDGFEAVEDWGTLRQADDFRRGRAVFRYGAGLRSDLMTKPTQEQIDTEIAWLEANKPRIRRTTAFGDDNHAAIDAQLEVLREKLTEKDVDDRSQFEDEVEADGVDESRWQQHVSDEARSAAQWLAGEIAETPSSGWAPLVK